MTAVPAAIQEDLALLLSLDAPEGRRAGTAYAAARALISPPPNTAAFDAGMDRLLRRRYVRAADTRLALAPAGELFLGSVAEFAAAQRAARTAFDKLTESGFAALADRVAALPARYGRRGGDYFVYTVLLAREAAGVGRFAAANPGWGRERPCLYVGMSSRPPLARFRNHLRGHKGSRYVRRFGLCLLPELFDHLNPLDRSGAAALEIDLAADLRAQGYGVLGVYAPEVAP